MWWPGKRKNKRSRAAVQEVERFDLPSFPKVAMEALRALRRPGTEPGRVADIIMHDPGLSARLLATVNSPAFALRHDVRNVHHAVALLGPSQIECLLITASLREALPNSNPEGFDRSRFWHTAARRATLAARLADQLAPAMRSEAFTAALLADMALPLLLESRGGDYAAVLNPAEPEAEPLEAREKARFGWDHAEVAAEMCRKWRFPDALTEAIEGHHRADLGIEAVDIVADLSDLGEDGEDLRADLGQQLAQTAGLDEDVAHAMVHGSFDDAEAIARLFA